MLVCGPCLTTTGGHGEFIGRTADSADELRRAVRELCRDGADFIKIMATGGSMDPETNRPRAQYSVNELRSAVEDAYRLQGGTLSWIVRPWYRSKTAVAFPDLLNVLRQELWRARFSQPPVPLRRLQNPAPVPRRSQQLAP